MKIITLFLLSISLFGFAQKNKKGLDVVSNIETKVLVMKAFGNNSLNKNLQPFYGFGFSGNLMTPINFGVGIDYNVLFSNVKYGQQNLYGNLGSPRMTMIDGFLTHRDKLSEEFVVEEMAGFSYYNYTSLYLDEKNRKSKNDGLGFNLGGKLVYILDMEGYQAVFFGAKYNYFSTNIYNEKPDIQKYYSRSNFLTLSLGYRYNF